jgi:hypothetical protein
MGTEGVQTKSVLPWLVRWAYRAWYKRFCPALAAVCIQLSTKKNFPRRSLQYLNSLVPSAQQAGQAVVLGRLSLICVSARTYLECVLMCKSVSC